MDIVLVAISIASLISNVVLVRHFTKHRVFLPATAENLPLWQDVAEELPVRVLEKEPEGAPAAVTAERSSSASPWENRTGIQQGNAAPALPPIVREPLPPLARPQGFV